VGSIVSFFYPPAGALLIAVDGYMEGGLQGALLSVASMAASAGVGDWFGPVGTFGNELARAAVHGLIQGALGAAQGGKFGAAFMSAAVTSGYGSKFGQMGNRVQRVIGAAVLGGTVSRIGGGKFANGAVTGAFVQAFGEIGSKAAESSPPYDPNTKTGKLLSVEEEGANIDAAMAWAQENGWISKNVSYEYTGTELWNETCQCYAFGEAKNGAIVFGRGAGSPHSRLNDVLGSTTGTETALAVGAHEFRHLSPINRALPPPADWFNPIDPTRNMELDALKYGNEAVLDRRGH
jgi:hypothetical protein